MKVFKFEIPCINKYADKVFCDNKYVVVADTMEQALLLIDETFGYSECIEVTELSRGIHTIQEEVSVFYEDCSV